MGPDVAAIVAVAVAVAVAVTTAVFDVVVVVVATPLLLPLFLFGIQNTRCDALQKGGNTTAALVRIVSYRLFYSLGFSYIVDFAF